MEIKVYATLRSIVGGPTVHLDQASPISVAQILQELCDKYPAIRTQLFDKEGRLHPAMHILINGRDMRYLNGVETVVTPQDVVRIFPPVGGGSG